MDIRISVKSVFRFVCLLAMLCVARPAGATGTPDTTAFSLGIIPGAYDELDLAYDPVTQMVTGYYEDASGWDEEVKAPRFSCIFYIEGKMTSAKFAVNTYFPGDTADQIKGTMYKDVNNGIQFSLSGEHGGCWNTGSIGKDSRIFKVDRRESWIGIRYVVAGKAFFYSDKKEDTRLKSYLVQGNVLHIDRIEGIWVHGVYTDHAHKRNTSGWMKADSFNTPGIPMIYRR